MLQATKKGESCGRRTTPPRWVRATSPTLVLTPGPAIPATNNLAGSAWLRCELRQHSWKPPGPRQTHSGGPARCRWEAKKRAHSSTPGGSSLRCVGPGGGGLFHSGLNTQVIPQGKAGFLVLKQCLSSLNHCLSLRCDHGWIPGRWLLRINSTASHAEKELMLPWRCCHEEAVEKRI